MISCSSPKNSLEVAKKEGPFDAVIVPGIPYGHGDASDRVLRGRVLWAWYLYSHGYTRNVIFSGSAVYTPYIEGKIMASCALFLGIPGERVFAEIRAEHSTENLVYSFRLADSLGFKKVAVATDPYQASILKLFAWDYRIPVKFVPFDSDTLGMLDKQTGRFVIDPSAAKVDSFVPLPERENPLERVLGTMGLKMK